MLNRRITDTLTLLALTALFAGCGSDADAKVDVEQPGETPNPIAVEIQAEDTTPPAVTGDVKFEFEDGHGVFKDLTLTPLPPGTQLELFETYLGETGGKQIFMSDGVLRIGDQTFNRLPLESTVEVANGKLIVNSEEWGSVDD